MGESIYSLMRAGCLDKRQVCERRSVLDNCGPQGRIAACYAMWLMLSRYPESEERDAHMAQNTFKLRHALEEVEKLSSYLSIAR